MNQQDEKPYYKQTAYEKQEKKDWAKINWEDIPDDAEDEVAQEQGMPEQEDWPEIGQYYTPETKERD